MTLVEFLAPLVKASHRDKILATLYYKHNYENTNALTIEQIRDELKKSRIKNWKKINISDVLLKSGHFVDTPGLQENKRLWNLTPSGYKYIKELLNLPETIPEIEHDVGTLNNLVNNITDPLVKDFIEESIKCLRVDALRATVVFLWSGSVKTIHLNMLTYNQSVLNAAIKKHDPKARDIKRIDHFSYIKDQTVLLAAQDLGLIDKNQKDTLEEALNLRNRCAHPGKYRPGLKKVSSFIEDIISILFQ